MNVNLRGRALLVDGFGFECCRCSCGGVGVFVVRMKVLRADVLVGLGS